MKKLFTLTLIGYSLLSSNNSTHAEVFIPAGTSISGIESQGASNGWGIPGLEYNSTTSTWTFTKKTSCNLSGYVIANTTNQAHSALCHKYAGSFLQQNDDGSGGLLINGAPVITSNTDGSVQIGSDDNDIDITSEGLTVDGVSLITKKESGEIHIGKNSLITKEEDGVQKLYAQDENGSAININVTNGSKLLIDGVEVTPSGTIPQVTTNKNNISTNKANIKNLGEGVAGSTALTAALSALPQTSKESKLSCGVGTGAYSSRYAVGFGCASKVNERVDVNAGGSYVFGGSKSYGAGTLDSGVVKAGFVFKLGELKKTTQITMKKQKEFKKEISILKGNNEKIISQNKKLATKNQSIIAQNKALLSRLERLEKIAMIGTKSKDLAVYKLK